MLIQYVLDSVITYVLPYPLIVSRQLARFASHRASRRRLRTQSLPSQRQPMPLFALLALSCGGSADRPFAVLSRRFRPSRKQHRKSTNFAQFWCNINPFRINTCKSVSKQTTLSIFRINTYEKTGGGGTPILVPLLTSLLRLISRTERE